MNQASDPAPGGAGDTADREIVILRVFDAPPERVWQAWTDLEGLSR